MNYWLDEVALDEQLEMQIQRIAYERVLRGAVETLNEVYRIGPDYYVSTEYGLLPITPRELADMVD
jgi:hypothetical protein